MDGLPDFHIPHAEKIEWMIETEGWAIEIWLLTEFDGHSGKARVFMVHGEPPVMEAFGRTLEERGREAVAPERDRTYDLA